MCIRAYRNRHCRHPFDFHSTRCWLILFIFFFLSQVSSNCRFVNIVVLLQTTIMYLFIYLLLINNTINWLFTRSAATKFPFNFLLFNVPPPPHYCLNSIASAKLATVRYALIVRKTFICLGVCLSACVSVHFSYW